MGFVLPAILLGLGAVALPVLVHLIRARKYQRVDLGTLRFLEAVLRERRRWRRVENWPLLLARITLIVLVTLLFARPFFYASNEGSPEDLEVFLLVDVSGSVSGLHFAEVRRAAAAALNDVPEDARVTVAAFADEVEVVESLDALDAIPGAGTDYAQAAKWTLDRIARSDHRNARVIWVSDLQRSGLPESPPRLWPANSRATVVRVNPSGSWNAAVTDVRLLTPYMADHAELEASIGSFGEESEPSRELTWNIEGGGETSGTVEGSRSWHRHEWNPQERTDFRGEIAIESDDAYPVDNFRPFFGELKPRAKIVLVEGTDQASPFDRDAYFLEKALNVSGSRSGQSVFVTKVESEFAGDLDAHCVVFCNAAGVDDATVPHLLEFVRKGGGLAFFLGPSTDPASFVPLAKAGLFPERLSRVAVPAPRPIEWWDTQSPLLAPFARTDQDDVRKIVLRDAFDVSGTDWQVLGSLSNGRAALLSRDLENGHILVFTNPVTREWSDFPQARIFLPMMREWIGWLAQLPSGDEEKQMVMAPGLKERRAPGVYDDNGRRIVVAANVPEMDVATVTEERFRDALGLPADHAQPRTDRDEAALSGAHERRNELHAWVALAVLGVMIGELFLADRRLHVRA